QGTDVMVCLTGVGVRALFGLAAELGREDRLREVFDRALVVIRGPKPLAVLRELRLRVDRQAAVPNTTAEVIKELEPETCQRVAVQLYGQPDPELTGWLEARGAEVLHIPVYRWELPQDRAPMIDLIDHLDRADGLTVTSSQQLKNLLAVAEANGRT